MRFCFTLFICLLPLLAIPQASGTVAFTSQPPPVLAVGQDQTAELSVTATGAGTISYQWFRNHAPIAGATAATYTAGLVTNANAGIYQCRVTDDDGAVFSHLCRVALRSGPVAWSSGALGQVLGWNGGTLRAVALVEGGGSPGEFLLLESGVISTQMLPTSNPDFFPTPLPTTGYPAEAVNLVQVAGGNGALIGLRSDGQVVLWRPTAYNGAGVLVDTATAAPSVHPALSSTRVKAVSMTSGGEALALTQSGEVYAWSFASAASSTPAVQSGVRGISSGMNNHVAVKEDGSVISWGVNPPAVPADLTDVAAVAAGSSTHLALKTDGTLVSWGGARQAGADPALLSGVQAISGSHEDFFAFQADGTTAVWKASTAVYLIGYQFPLSPVPAEAVYSTAGRSVTTSSFALGLRADGLRLVTAPQGFSGRQGDRLRLVGGFTSNFAISYQWKKNDADIPGATSAVYEVLLAQPSDSGSYTLTATAADGTHTTTAVTVTITPAPYLTLQPPASVAMYAGDAFTLDTEAVTTGTAQFQWLRNGREVPGATSADVNTAVFDPAQHEGVWVLRMTDDNGTRFSQRSLVARAAGLTSWRNGVSASLSLDFNAALLGFSSGDPHWVLFSGGGLAGIQQPTGLGFFNLFFPTGPAVPSSLSGVVQAAARGNRCVALRADGGVTSWESVAAGSSGGFLVINGSMTAQLSDVPAAAQQDLLGVSLGGSEAVAVKTNGSVVVWDVVTGALLASPAGLSNVARVSSGLDHHLALRADGTVAAWGDDTEGECQVPAGLVNVVEIAAGDHFSLALKSDGTVTAWGRNVEGQCNVPAGLGTVRTISASGGMAMVVKTDGSHVTWGSGDAGTPDLTTVVAGTRPLISAAVHRGSTANLRAGAGLFAHERLTFIQQPQSQTIMTSDGVSFTARVTGFPAPTSFYWYRNGQIVANGSQDLATGTYTLTYPSGLTSADAGDYTLQVSNGGQTVTSQPATLTVLPGPSISTQSSGLLSSTENTSGTLSVTATASAGTLAYQWFRDGQPVAGATTSSIAVNVTTSPGLYQLQITDANATRFSRLMPVTTPLWLDTWRDGVAALLPTGSQYTAISLSNGHAVSGTFNLLNLVPDTSLHGGQPWPAASQPPSPPPGTLGGVWVRVATYGDRALALQNNGRVMAWERDSGLSTSHSLPVPATLQNVVAISLGEAEGLALLTGGGLARWNLSDGAVLSVPAGLGAVTSIASGKDHHLLCLLDGTVAALGNDSDGESTVPAGLTNVVAVAAGDDFSLALKQDGTVTAWGSNSAGQTTLPAGLTGIQTICASQRSAFAVNASGVVTCWGEHGAGQNGWPDFRTVPAAITPAVACGLWGNGSDAVALTMAKPSVPVITQQPQNQSANQGSSVTFSVQARCRPGAVATVWYVNGSYYGLRYGPSLTLTASASSTWRVEVANNQHPLSTGPFVRSDPFTLTVFTRPVITTPLTPVFIRPGSSGEISVNASSNAGPISYQWQRNGRNIPGATSSTLPLPALTPATEGIYRVLLTNTLGTTKSELIPVMGRYEAVAWRIYGLGEWENGNSLVVGGWSSGEPYYLYNVNTRQFEATGVRYAQDSSFPYLRTRNTVPSFTGVKAACRDSTYLKINSAGVASGEVWNGGMWVPPHTPAIDVGIDKQGRPLLLLEDGGVIWWSHSARNTLTTPTISNASAISCGKDHHLVLLDSGSVVAFGDNSNGECDVPADLTDVVQIAAGDDFSLVLKADGSLLAWGQNSSGETTIPAGLAGVSRISASGAQAMAVLSDGSAVRWGRVVAGRHDVSPPPASLRPMAQLSTISYGYDESSFAVGLRHARLPQIVEAPTNVSAAPGGMIQLSVSARSPHVLSYQWRKDGVPLPGQTRPMLILSPASPADAGQYDVEVTSVAGMVRSAAGTVTVSAGDLTITSQPPPTLPLARGQGGTLTVQAVSALPVSYQWFRGSLPLPGATAATLEIPPLTRGTDGVYHCRVRTAVEEKWSWLTLVGIAGYMVAWDPWTSAMDTRAYPQQTMLLALGAGDANLSIDAAGALRVTDTSSIYDSRDMTIPSGLPPSVAAGTRMYTASDSLGVCLGNDGVVRAWKLGYNGITALRTGPPEMEGAVDIELVGNTLFCLRRDGLVVSWNLTNLSDAGYQPVVSVRPVHDAVSFGALNPDVIWLARDGSLYYSGTPSYGQYYHRLPTSDSPFVSVTVSTGWLALATTESGWLYGWGPSSLGENGRGERPSVGAVGGYTCFTSGRVGYQNHGGALPGFTMPEVSIPVTQPLVQMAQSDNSRLLVLQRFWYPEITVQPTGSRAVAQGEVVWLTAQVGTPPAGSPPVTWEWLNGDTVVATGTSLGISSFTAADAGTYRLRGTSLGGQVFSDPVVLTYLTSGFEITSQPQDQNVNLNTPVTLTAAATSTQPLEWQWYRDGLAIPGATTASHTFTATGGTSGRYQFRVGNATEGYRFSNVAFIRIFGTYREWGRRQRQPDSPVIETALGTNSGLSLLPNGTVQKAGTGWTPNISSADNTGIRAVFARGKRVAMLTRTNKVIEWEAIASLYSWDYLPRYTQMEGQPFVQLALGERQTLALRQDGSLTTYYGSPNQYGVLDIPAGLTDIAQIAAGNDHCIALRRDGTVVAWGRNDLGQCSVPAGLAQVVQIAANQHYNLALKSDGTLVAWGSLNVPPAPAPAMPEAEDAPPEAPAPATEDSITSRVTVIIVNPPTPSADWGYAPSDFGPTLPAAPFSPLPVRISAGEGRCAALLADGSVRTWAVSSPYAPPAGMGTACAVAAGGDSHAALLPFSPPVITAFSDVFVTHDGTYLNDYHAALKVTATSAAQLTYVWKRGSDVIEGQNLPYLNFRPATTAHSGDYTVVVSNPAGSVESPVGAFRVAVPQNYTTWVGGQFTPQEVAAGQTGPTADPDARGIPNLLRYALGMSGANPDRSALPSPALSNLPDGRRRAGITFCVPHDVTGITYSILVTSDMVTWQNVFGDIVPGPIIGDKRQYTIYDPNPPANAATPRFIRLQVNATP